MENQELIPVLECRQPAVVQDNLVDLQQRVSQVMAVVEGLPRTRESLPQVRSARAELNKYYASLETQRKLVKAAVMQPYTEAEKRYKELVGKPIEAANEKCREFLEGVESAVKQECEDTLRAYFGELCQAKGIYWLPFERVGIKVTLAMTDQKELRGPKERIRSFVQKVDDDLKTITGMEDSADLLAEYERILDLSTAISNVGARKRAKAIMEENRTKWEARKSAEAQNIRHMEEQVPEPVVQQEKKFYVTFTVTSTIPMLRGLKAFLDGNHYEYQEVTNNGN